MKRPRLVSFLAISLLVVACAENRALVSEPAPRPLGAGIPVFRAAGALADEEPAPPAEPTGVITLQNALAAALMGSPDLAEASWAIRAAEARAVQAGLPSNPELEVEAEEFGGEGERAGFGGAEFGLGLSQELILGGKLGRQVEVADLESRLAGWDYESRRLDVLSETVEAFISVLAAQERVGLLEESVRIAAEVVRAVREQVAAGKVSRLEANRAAVAHALQKVQLDRTVRELQSVRRALAATWGGTYATFASARGELRALRPVPSRERLEAHLEENPDIARIAVEREFHRARLDLARSGAWPDLTLSAGLSRFEETNEYAFTAGFSLPLPVFDQGQAGVSEARAEAAGARERWRAAAARIAGALLDAHQELAASAAEAETLRNQVMPAAEEAFAASEEGFRQGKFSYLEVLDAQRTLFETKEQYLTALVAYHEAVARVERLIGRSLGSVRTDGQE